jgi:serine/threonine protein kinase
MCQHPNVIRLIDFFENESYHFIVLEHCKGKNLYDYL